MKDIKTRETVKDIRVLDRAANAAEHMKDAYIRTKNEADIDNQAEENSPTSYAESRTAEAVQRAVDDTMASARRQEQRLVSRTVHDIMSRDPKARAAEPPASDHKASPDCEPTQYAGRGAPQRKAKPAIESTRSNLARTETEPTKLQGAMRRSAIKARDSANAAMRMTERSAKGAEQRTARTAKGTAKAAGKGIKTAESSSRAAIKTTQQSAKAAAKSAQVTAKAAQKSAYIAKKAAKSAATAFKTVAKAAAETVKAILAALKGLVVAIASGGWVAVIVIVVILLAACILGSVFGVFASGESYDGSPAMPEVIAEINAEFSATIEGIISSVPHDILSIDNSGTATMTKNWNEVLSLYAVLVTSDPDSPCEVATLDDKKAERLRTVFWDMNHIDYTVSTVTVGTDDEDNAITATLLTIIVTYTDLDTMIYNYGLSDERRAQVYELLEPKYSELFMRLTGSYSDIDLSAEEIAAIVETLPEELSEERRQVVLTAYSLVGKVNYFWGGKSLVIGWDNRWGVPMTVTSDGSRTTGTVRPFGLDCSGFVDWTFFNAYGGACILGQGGGTDCQNANCDTVAWASAMPGDLVFYPGYSHVGIVVKNDAGTLTVIHCSSSKNNVAVTTHRQYSGFSICARPKIFGD